MSDFDIKELEAALRAFRMADDACFAAGQNGERPHPDAKAERDAAALIIARHLVYRTDDVLVCEFEEFKHRFRDGTPL